MYRKKFKQRKISNTNGPQMASTSFHSVETVPQSAVPKTPISNELKLPCKRPLANSTNSFHSTNYKRKLFDDFDLSDLKLDTTLPSFSVAAKHTETSFNSTIQSLNTSHDMNYENQSNNLLADLNDIDFEEDIYQENDVNKSNQKVNLSDNDKEAMLRLVKSEMLRSHTNDEDDFSDLLNDDFEIDDEDLCTLGENTSNKDNCESGTEISIGTEENICFKTATGVSIVLDSVKIEAAKLRFQYLDSILLKEIACYLWNEANLDVG